jgi:hypothetical protein
MRSERSISGELHFRAPALILVKVRTPRNLRGVASCKASGYVE